MPEAGPETVAETAFEAVPEAVERLPRPDVAISAPTTIRTTSPMTPSPTRIGVVLRRATYGA
jgi:hypothetical protein